MTAYKQTVIHLFITAQELIDLAKKAEAKYANTRPGSNLEFDSISTKENIEIKFIVDQSKW